MGGAYYQLVYMHRQYWETVAVCTMIVAMIISIHIIEEPQIS